MSEKRINCLRCIHYFSTHDPTLPRGCRLYKFRTKDIPALVVKKETGSNCLGFKERSKNKPESFRDKKFW